MQRKAGATVAVCVVAVFAAWGCGSSDSGGGGTTSGGGNPTTTTASSGGDPKPVAAPPVVEKPGLTKVVFIRKADAICKRTDEIQRGKLGEFTIKHPNAEATAKGNKEMVENFGLPPLVAQVQKLAALGAPQGEEKEVQAIISGFEKAVEEGQEDPASLLESGAANPFSGPDELAAEYGFKECDSAL